VSDFGRAKQTGPLQKISLTSKVVMISDSPSESLMGSDRYPQKYMSDPPVAFSTKGHFRTQPDDNKADFPEYVDSTLPPQSELEMDLLMRMLEYNATKRISLQVVLENQYIKTHGDQIIPENIPPMPLAEMYQ
jgi:serine/threonine protein kinase